MVATSSGSAGDAGQTAKPSPSERPHDAATLVIVDLESGEPRVLMGRRRSTQVFMPNKIVFPGGRVDECDRMVSSADELAACETTKLLMEMKGYPSAARARALALAAIRETFEETGIVIGHPVDEFNTDTAKAVDVADGWQNFVDLGFYPALSQLSLFARAITPPGRRRRYDTRFFCIPATAISLQDGTSDGELSDLGWYAFKEAIELDLPPITRVIIEDLEDRLRAGPLGPLAAPLPFYHQRHGNFRRELLSVEGTE